MLERLQKIIARAGIASRRHAEQLILSGQVKVNGAVVTELGSKADPEKDRIEAAGKLVENNERRVYIVLNKPVEVVSTMADPEGRKTLRNCLRGLPERVYPVGRLDYAASGLVFLTNDGDLTAEMLKDWENLQQVYHVKIKGRLMLQELERVGGEAGAVVKTVRQPDATRGHAANFWYEVTLRDSKKDILRRVLFAENHPVEKLKRIALGPMTLEGLPQGHYKLLNASEVEALRVALKEKPKVRVPYVAKAAASAPTVVAGDEAEASASMSSVAGEAEQHRPAARIGQSRFAAKGFDRNKFAPQFGKPDRSVPNKYGPRKFTGKKFGAESFGTGAEEPEIISGSDEGEAGATPWGGAPAAPTEAAGQHFGAKRFPPNKFQRGKPGGGNFARSRPESGERGRDSGGSARPLRPGQFPAKHPGGNKFQRNQAARSEFVRREAGDEGFEEEKAPPREFRPGQNRPEAADRRSEPGGEKKFGGKKFGGPKRFGSGGGAGKSFGGPKRFGGGKPGFVKRDGPGDGARDKSDGPRKSFGGPKRFGGGKPGFVKRDGPPGGRPDSNRPSGPPRFDSGGRPGKSFGGPKRFGTGGGAGKSFGGPKRFGGGKPGFVKRDGAPGGRPDSNGPGGPPRFESGGRPGKSFSGPKSFGPGGAPRKKFGGSKFGGGKKGGPRGGGFSRPPRKG